MLWALAYPMPAMLCPYISHASYALVYPMPAMPLCSGYYLYLTCQLCSGYIHLSSGLSNASYALDKALKSLSRPLMAL